MKRLLGCCGLVVLAVLSILSPVSGAPTASADDPVAPGQIQVQLSPVIGNPYTNFVVKVDNFHSDQPLATWVRGPAGVTEVSYANPRTGRSGASPYLPSALGAAAQVLFSDEPWLPFGPPPVDRTGGGVQFTFVPIRDFPQLIPPSRTGTFTLYTCQYTCMANTFQLGASNPPVITGGNGSAGQHAQECALIKRIYDALNFGDATVVPLWDMDPPIRIGIYGLDPLNPNTAQGCGLPFPEQVKLIQGNSTP
jgi:hypothetical protein